MRIWIYSACALLLAACPVMADEPASISSIAAVVNDDVISSLDVDRRLQMVLVSTRLEDTEETRERLRPQILRSLIDEKLQLQEAARSGVEVTQEDMEHALHVLEEQRGLGKGELLVKLDEAGLPRGPFLDQLRAQVAWTKLVLKTVRPKVKVSDDEIDRERSKAAASGGAPEVQIEVLALPVDHPENDAQVRKLAEKLAEGVRGGASFESVARELGPAASSAQNIAPFWVSPDQLDPALAREVAQASPNTIVGPVRTLEGYMLARLLGRRQSHTAPGAANNAEVVYKDILLKLKGNASHEDANLMLNIGRDVAKNPGTCSEPGIAGVQNLQDFDIQVAFRREQLQAMPQQLQDILSHLSVGNASEPYATADGIQLFMLCERMEKPAAPTDREEVAQHLFQQKLELEAQKYLRNLRRDATIDIKT